MQHPALTFVLAPLPNAIFSQCGGDEFSASYEGSGPEDLGRFITAIIVVTGFAFPLVLTHSEVITSGACAMSIVGGGYVSFFPLDTLILTCGKDWYMVQYRRIPLPSSRILTITIHNLCVFPELCIVWIIIITSCSTLRIYSRTQCRIYGRHHKYSISFLRSTLTHVHACATVG